MSGAIAEQSRSEEELRAAWPDERLVRECLNGSDAAWSGLIDKYKNLIYSIPLKYGLAPDAAADIFQSVCLELLSELPKLRKPRALPKWIMQVTAHKCFHRKREQQRFVSTDEEATIPEPSVPASIERILREAAEEQTLRDAIGRLPERCRELVYMLFFEEPSRPYAEIAQSLGIATGSVGFIRQRCLERLRKQLAEAGF
jgi:RNA polymerase sigma factor (sigma-70 family)